MKKILCLLLLLTCCGLVHAQGTPAAAPITLCAPGVPCGQYGPVNTGDGDQWYQFGWKFNTASKAFFGEFGLTSNLAVNGVLLPTDIANFFGCGGDVNLVLNGAGGCSSGGGSGGTPGGINGQIQYNNNGIFGGFTPGGDCSFTNPNFTCLKTNGINFGTFATQNTPTGLIQCLQVNSGGIVSGTGTTCGGSGGGNMSNSGTPTAGQLGEWVTSTTMKGFTLGGDCTFSDPNITCTKTGGSVFGSFATQSAPTGSTQCLQANTSGVVSGIGNACLAAQSQNPQTTSYTLVIGDANNRIYMNCVSACTLTIPANASVAFPVPTHLDIYVDPASAVVTLAITTDTLTFSPVNTTGSRTLAAGAKANIDKYATTKWNTTGAGET